MKDHRDDALVTLRAAYPEWIFELDGQAISARLAPSRHLLLWTGIAAWKAKVISWPTGPALADRLGGYVASSPDEVRCMASLLGVIAAEESAAEPDAPEVAAEPAEIEVAEIEVAELREGDVFELPDAPDDGLAHDDWELPPVSIAMLNEALEGCSADIAGLRDQIIFAHRERDEARAELERVKAERDELLAPICAPSVPEPPPRAGGALVTPLVLAWIASQRPNIGQERVDQALRLVMERDAFGRTKYGQGLALEDGRDTFEDLRQELGDALQYGLKLRVEGVGGERLEEVRWLVHLLWLLLCADKVEVGP